MPKPGHVRVTFLQAAGTRSEAFSYAHLVLARASDRTDCVSKGLQMRLLNASLASSPIPGICSR